MIVKFKFFSEDYYYGSNMDYGETWHENQERFIVLDKHVCRPYHMQAKRIKKVMSENPNKDILVLSWPSDHVINKNKLLRKIISGREIYYFDHGYVKWFMKEVWIYKPRTFIVKPMVARIVDFKYFIDADREEYEQLLEQNKERIIFLETDLSYAQQNKKIRNEITNSKDILVLSQPTELILNRNKILQHIKRGRGINYYFEEKDHVWFPKEVWIYNPIIPDFYME